MHPVEAALMTAHRTTTGWWRVTCPYCGSRTGKDDKRASMSVSVTTGRYVCWKCNVKGRIKLPDIIPELVLDQQVAVQPIDLPEGFCPLYDESAARSYTLRPAMEYMANRLQGRGSLSQILLEARIGACVEGKQANRIIVPIYDLDDETVVGWVGRDWTGYAQLKYVYPPGMQRILFNRKILDSIDQLEYVLIVEGVFDALAVWPNVVACLGKPTDQQVDMLRECHHPMVVALDGDAWQEGWALAQRISLTTTREAVYIKLPPQRDPATVPRSWIHGQAMKALQRHRDTGG